MRLQRRYRVLSNSINKMDRRKKIGNFIKKTEPMVTIIVWSSVIFYFSSISGLKSDFKDFFDLILRKTAHILEYTVLTFLCFRAASKVVFKNKSSTNSGQTFGFKSPKLVLDKKHALIGVFIFTFLYAISDEIHQLFVFHREGKITDVFIDGMGIMIGLIFLYRFKKDNK